MATVTTVLVKLDKYLRDNLSVDSHLASELFGWKPMLIDGNARSYIRAQFIQGKRDECFQHWRDQAENYNVLMLEEWCKCLKNYSKSVRPKLKDIAIRVEEELRDVQKLKVGPSRESGKRVSSVEEHKDKPLSQNEKVQAIVRLYLNRKVFLPKNAKLIAEYSRIMGFLKAALDPRTISIEEGCRIEAVVDEMNTNISEGILPQPSPSPDPNKLFEFIKQHSGPYRIFLVEEAIKVLNKRKLNKMYTKYKEDLTAWMEEKIDYLESSEIVLPDLSRREDCLALCTSSKGKHQVLLAFIFEMHDFLKTYLQLDCSRLLGMQKGCTIVYFSISAVDANLLAPRIQSHLTELKEKFSVSYIVLIDHFVVDVESGDFEVLPPSAWAMTQEDFHIGTEEPEGSVKALALQLSEATLELPHQTPDQLDDVDVQAKSDLLKDKIAELEPHLERPLSEHRGILALAGVPTERSSTSDRQKAEWFSNYSEALQKAVHEQDFQEDSDLRKFLKSQVKNPESKKYACCVFDSRGVTDFRSYIENVVYIGVSQGKAPYAKRFFKVTDYQQEEQMIKWYEEIRKENGKVNEVRLETHDPEVFSASDTAILMINAFGKKNLSHKGNTNPQLKNVQRRSTSQEIPVSEDKLGALFLHQTWQACEQGRMIELPYDTDETPVTAQETPIPDQPWPRVQDPADNP